MKIKYSVIIPAFNIEGYLHNIVNFTEEVLSVRHDIEIIVIDDGSTDNTSLIKERHKNILYIYQKNGCVSSARNHGLKVSSGEFVLFLDADDSYDVSLFNELDLFTINKEANIFLFNFLINKKPQNINLKLSNNNINWDLLSEYFFTRKIKLHICSICFRKKHLLENNILFPVGYSFGEDIFFILLSIYKENSIFYIKKPLYNYNFHHGSVVNTVVNYNKTKVLELYLKLLENEYKNNPFIVYFIQRTYLYLIKLCLIHKVSDERTVINLKKYKPILKIKTPYNNKPFIIIKNIMLLTSKFVFLLINKNSKVKSNLKATP